MKKIYYFYNLHSKQPLLQNAISDSSDHEHIFHVITQLRTLISWYQNSLHKTR